MPAPAVIPALLAYIEVDAVKKLVVGVVRVLKRGIKTLCSSKGLHGTLPIHWIMKVLRFALDYFSSTFTLRKLECL